MSDSFPSTARILIVDDEKDITTVLKMLLDDSGYPVDSFQSAKAALAAFTPGKYQIALIDLKMREMDGVELSKKLTCADPAIKVCFMSAYDWHNLPSSQRMSENTIQVNQYFRKPFSPMQLLTSIREMLEGEMTI